MRQMMSKVLTGILTLTVLAACSGKPDQQADATQPASGTAEPAQQPAATQPPAQQPSQPAAQRPPASTPAPAKPVVRTASVPSGSVLSLALDSGLSSKTALVGDAFSATVVEPVVVDGREVIPAGSKVEGKVTEAIPAKRGAGNAKLAMSFDQLTLPSGYKTNIVGTFQEVTESKKKRNAAIIGGSAAGGALLGRILGKDTKGAVIGAVVAGGIGTAVVMGKEGEQAKLPADTPFEIRLEEAVQVPQPVSGS